MKVLIAGYGRMGQLIEQTLLAAGDEVTARIDIASDPARGISDAAALASMDKCADLIMDFSNPSLTDELIAYASRTETPLLSGTTNMTLEQMDDMEALGEKIPVIWRSNYSFGINLFRHILGEIAPVSLLKGQHEQIASQSHLTIFRNDKEPMDHQPVSFYGTDHKSNWLFFAV